MDKNDIINIDDYKFSNQNWIKVLDEIWKFAPNRHGRGKTNYSDDHELARILKIKGYELGLIMMFLEENKLIEYDSNDYINLTSKGFDVALKNQDAISTKRISKSSLYFSSVIAIFATINLFLGIKNVYLGIGVLLLILLGISLLTKQMKKL